MKIYLKILTDKAGHFVPDKIHCFIAYLFIYCRVLLELLLVNYFN